MDCAVHKVINFVLNVIKTISVALQLCTKHGGLPYCKIHHRAHENPPLTYLAPLDTGTSNLINSYSDSWFQTFTVLWMLYAFFWVMPRRLNFICPRFGTFCSIFLSAYEDVTECSETSAYKIHMPGNYPEESIQQVFWYYPPIFVKVFDWGLPN
jgi:hypothetical protein